MNNKETNAESEEAQEVEVIESQEENVEELSKSLVVQSSSLSVTDPNLYAQLDAIIKSKKIPGLRNVEQAFVKYELGKSLGLDPIVSVCTNGIYFIKDIPALDTATAMALMIQAGHSYNISERFKCKNFNNQDDIGIEVTIQRKGEKMLDESGNPILRKFVLYWKEDCEVAGWTVKPIWKQMPKIMFRYRALIMAIRLHCPEVLKGMKELDEICNVSYNEDGTVSKIYN